MVQFDRSRKFRIHFRLHFLFFSGRSTALSPDASSPHPFSGHFHRVSAQLFPRTSPESLRGFFRASFRAFSPESLRGSFRTSHQSTCTALFALLPAHFIKLPARLLSHKNIPLRNDVQRIPRSGRRPPLDGHDNRDARLFFNIVPKTECFRFPPGSVFCFRPAFAGGPASEGADRAKIKNCCISWYVIFCKISSFSASSLAASLSIYSPMRRKVQREIQFSHRSARLSLPIAKAKGFTIHRIKLFTPRSICSFLILSDTPCSATPPRSNRGFPRCRLPRYDNACRR